MNIKKLGITLVLCIGLMNVHRVMCAPINYPNLSLPVENNTPFILELEMEYHRPHGKPRIRKQRTTLEPGVMMSINLKEWHTEDIDSHRMKLVEEEGYLKGIKIITIMKNGYKLSRNNHKGRRMARAGAASRPRSAKGRQKS